MSNLDNIYNAVTECPFDSQRVCPVLVEKADPYMNDPSKTTIEKERLIGGIVWRAQELLRRQGNKTTRRLGATGCDVSFVE